MKSAHVASVCRVKLSSNHQFLDDIRRWRIELPIPRIVSLAMAIWLLLLLGCGTSSKGVTRALAASAPLTSENGSTTVTPTPAPESPYSAPTIRPASSDVATAVPVAQPPTAGAINNSVPVEEAALPACSPHSDLALRFLAMLNPRQGFALDTAGRLLRAIDGGIKWQATEAAVTPSLAPSSRPAPP